MGTTIVQKYGGSSLATPEQIRAVARHIVQTRRAGHRVVVVVSAMGESTDHLLELAQQVSGQPSRRELDMLVSVGERISMALVSMAVEDLGQDAISFTGSQCGIMTDDRHCNARIIEVRPFRVADELQRGRVVIVAGFQGTSYRRDVTTLGRGGSDTTAVALAAALSAEACEIYSDVDGVYSADPRKVEGTEHIPELSYAEMEAFARSGARVLHSRAVQLAREAGIAIYARATQEPDGRESVVRLNLPETGPRVLGVTGRSGVLRLLGRHPDGGVALVDRLTDEGHQILSWSRRGDELELLLQADQQRLGAPKGVEVRGGLSTVSLVGQGVEADPALVAKLTEEARALDLELLGLAGAEASLTALIAAPSPDTLVARLHAELVFERVRPDH